MKILVISQHYYPENFRITDICETLVQMGHQVDVICGLPNYPEGEVLKDYKHGKNREQVINGVNIHRCFEIGRGKSKFKLFLNYYSVCLSMLSKAKKLKEKFDVVFINQLSPVMQAWAGIAYAKKHKVPCLLYCLDLWPESLKASFNNKENFVFKYYKNISSRIYNSCDRVAVSSKPFKTYISKMVNNDEKIVYLPQYGEDEYITTPIKNIDNGIIDFVFAGNLGMGQTLDVILKAAKRIKTNKKFKIHIVGNGSKYDELKKMVVEYQLEEIIILHGRKSAEEIREYYDLADALLITLRGNNFVGNTLPGKMQTYLTVGKPIFGAINGATADIINESFCGACVSSGDFVGYSEILNHFINNTSEYSSCGINAQNYYLEHFTKEKFFSDLEKIFKSLI